MLRARKIWPWLLILCFVASGPVWAQDDEEDAEAPVSEDAEASAEGGDDVQMPYSGVIYLPLKPPFVVNYGGPGPLRYLKADITVRLQDAKTANSVRHHMPYIRNNLVMLFSAQTEESVGSQEGKELLRQEALTEVRNVILQEDQQEGVIDLYFNTILVQR